MLERVDRLLAPVTWIIAGALLIMLFAGPQVIAEDEAKPANTAEAAGAQPYASGASTPAEPPPGDGRALFVDNCGSCHALAEAGSAGGVGPPLDGTTLDADAIAAKVRDGSGSMPAFAGELTDDEIAAVAAFVEGAP
jgi:sulfite dehydrogenase